MHEAKTHLSQLVLAVENGEEVVISRKGVPVAKLVALSPGWSTAQPDNSPSPISPDVLGDWEETDVAIKKMFASHLAEGE